MPITVNIERCETIAFATCQQCTWGTDKWSDETSTTSAARLHVEGKGHRVALEVQYTDLFEPGDDS